jgi:hypothetical protein
MLCGESLAQNKRIGDHLALAGFRPATPILKK